MARPSPRTAPAYAYAGPCGKCGQCGPPNGNLITAWYKPKDIPYCSSCYFWFITNKIPFPDLYPLTALEELIEKAGK